MGKGHKSYDLKTISDVSLKMSDLLASVEHSEYDMKELMMVCIDFCLYLTDVLEKEITKEKGFEA